MSVSQFMLHLCPFIGPLLVQPISMQSDILPMHSLQDSAMFQCVQVLPRFPYFTIMFFAGINATRSFTLLFGRWVNFVIIYWITQQREYLAVGTSERLKFFVLIAYAVWNRFGCSSEVKWPRLRCVVETIDRSAHIYGGSAAGYTEGSYYLAVSTI